MHGDLRRYPVGLPIDVFEVVSETPQLLNEPRS
jgi:hypothetical protein